MIAQVFRALLPAEVAVAAADPSVDRRAELYPEERALVAHAIERRQRELAAGRWAARRALATLGRAAGAIDADDRRPRWPAGLVGSISHTRRWAVAAVAPVGVLRGLGIDLEDVPAEAPEWWERICVGGERAWVREPDGRVDPARVIAVFSGKESVFKSQHALTGIMLEHDDLELAFAGDGRFAVRFHRALPLDPSALRGRHGRVDGAVLTAVTLGAC